MEPLPVSTEALDPAAAADIITTLQSVAEAGRGTWETLQKRLEAVEKELNLSKEREAATASLLKDALASTDKYKAQRNELSLEANRLRKINQQLQHKSEQAKDELALVKYLKQPQNDEEFAKLVSRFDTSTDRTLFLSVLHNRLREENSVSESKEAAKERWKQNAIDLKAANDRLIARLHAQEAITSDLQKNTQDLKTRLKRLRRRLNRSEAHSSAPSETSSSHVAADETDTLRSKRLRGSCSLLLRSDSAAPQTKPFAVRLSQLMQPPAAPHSTESHSCDDHLQDPDQSIPVTPKTPPAANTFIRGEARSSGALCPSTPLGDHDAWPVKSAPEPTAVSTVADESPRTEKENIGTQTAETPFSLPSQGTSLSSSLAVSGPNLPFFHNCSDLSSVEIVQPVSLHKGTGSGCITAGLTSPLPALAASVRIPALHCQTPWIQKGNSINTVNSLDSSNADGSSYRSSISQSPGVHGSFSLQRISHPPKVPMISGLPATLHDPQPPTPAESALEPAQASTPKRPRSDSRVTWTTLGLPTSPSNSPTLNSGNGVKCASLTPKGDTKPLKERLQKRESIRGAVDELIAGQLRLYLGIEAPSVPVASDSNVPTPLSQQKRNVSLHCSSSPTPKTRRKYPSTRLQSVDIRQFFRA